MLINTDVQEILTQYLSIPLMLAYMYIKIAFLSFEVE
jgi:hypothetical protein